MADEENKEGNFLATLKSIIIGLSEIDQECAVLDTLYREQSMNKIVARLDEVTGSIMIMKEKVKETKIEQYDKGKYNSLNRKQF